MSLLAVPVWAFGITVQPLPSCEYADTEVSMFVPLRIPARNARGLDLSLEFNLKTAVEIMFACGG